MDALFGMRNHTSDKSIDAPQLVEACWDTVTLCCEDFQVHNYWHLVDIPPCTKLLLAKKIFYNDGTQIVPKQKTKSHKRQGVMWADASSPIRTQSGWWKCVLSQAGKCGKYGSLRNASGFLILIYFFRTSRCVMSLQQRKKPLISKDLLKINETKYIPRFWFFGWKG